MSKFGSAVRRPPTGPLGQTGSPTVTHEGGHGFELDARTGLFTLAVTNMVGETTFYESAGQRDKRFIDLVTAVAAEDPAWAVRFVPWLRNVANMRSAPLVMAIELAAALPDDSFALADGSLVWRADIVDSAIVRADEPAEAVGYWLSTRGKVGPRWLKTGIARACARVYTERNLLKYDGTQADTIRFGDVIDLCHPRPRAPWQAALFKHALDRRHNRADAKRGLDLLPLLTRAYALDATPTDGRRSALAELPPSFLGDAGYTWERLAGWLPGGMDAEGWEAIIPHMGVMALIRNLRNIEDAGVSAAVCATIEAKLMDPDVIAGSRQLPFRWWSAWKNSGTMRFGPALERAAELSFANVPTFDGRTFVMVDTSGSMQSVLSAKTVVTRVEAAAVLAAGVAHSSPVDLAIYGQHGLAVGDCPRSLLRTVDKLHGLIGAAGHSTNTWPSLLSLYNGQDRVIVVTDEQHHPARAGHLQTHRESWQGYDAVGRPQPRAGLAADGLPNCPIYVWNVAGYGRGGNDLSVPNRYLLGGFSDAAFKLIKILESGRSASWDDLFAEA